MADPTYQYPFDYTGTAATNKVVNERHILTRNNHSDFHYIIPKFAPYFESTLKMTYTGSDGVTRELVEGIEWYSTHKFKEATLSTASPIYGSITFLNNKLAGVIKIQYQTLGGKWTLDEAEIQHILATDIQNPRTTYWGEITNLPDKFPVTNHDFNIIDFTGMKDVEIKLGDIEQAIRSASGTTGPDHIKDFDNPHKVNKIQIQLGNVLNLPILPATLGSNNTDSYYMTPRGTRAIIDFYIKPIVDSHLSAKGNVHGATPADIGAPSIAQFNTGLAGKLDVSATAYNTHRFNNLSPEEYKTFVLEGKTADSDKLDGRSYRQLVIDISSELGSATNGVTRDQVIQLIGENKSADTTLWNGRTEDELAITFSTNLNINAGLLQGKTYGDILAAMDSKIISIGAVTQEDISDINDRLDVFTQTSSNTVTRLGEIEEQLTQISTNTESSLSAFNLIVQETARKTGDLELSVSDLDNKLDLYIESNDIIVNSHTSTLTAHRGRLDNLETAQTNFTDALAVTNQTVTDLTASLTNLDDIVDAAVSANLTAVTDKVDAMNTLVNDLNLSFTNMTNDTGDKFASLDSAIADIDADLVIIKADIANLDLTNINTTLTDHGNRIGDNEIALQSLAAWKATAQTNIDDLGESILDATSEIDILKNDNSSLNTRLSTAETAVQTVTDTVDTTLVPNMALLQNKVNGGINSKWNNIIPTVDSTDPTSSLYVVNLSDDERLNTVNLTDSPLNATVDKIDITGLTKQVIPAGTDLPETTAPVVLYVFGRDKFKVNIGNVADAVSLSATAMIKLGAGPNNNVIDFGDMSEAAIVGADKFIKLVFNRFIRVEANGSATVLWELDF